jgi:hypothetical protein
MGSKVGTRSNLRGDGGASPLLLKVLGSLYEHVGNNLCPGRSNNNASTRSPVIGIVQSCQSFPHCSESVVPFPRVLYNFIQHPESVHLDMSRRIKNLSDIRVLLLITISGITPVYTFGYDKRDYSLLCL